jgi:uncharacterized protein involved in outer membrane biogenesis
MKLFLKILAGILILIVVAAAGLRIYFNDERLRETVVPLINESVGTQVQVQSMSLSLFSTFPYAGVRMQGFVLPDKEGNTVVSLQELVLSIKILPLLSNNIQMAELILRSPEIQYRVHNDGTTNFDFLMAPEQDETSEEGGGLSLAIPELVLQNGTVHYTDESSGMAIDAQGLSGTLGLQFDELIQTDLKAEVQSLSVKLDGEDYLSGMKLSLQQKSVLNLDKETLEIKEGSLGIRGLKLQMNGTIDSWGSEATNMRLSLVSSSDDFGELLGLVPPEYEEYMQGLETRGSLKLKGSINGALTETALPDFNFTIQVTDGYVKNSELPEAIQNIQLSFVADNNRISIQHFTANAAQNDISVTGKISDPLAENPGFDLNINGEADLSTVEKFYPIKELEIQRLAGQLKVKLNAKGNFDEPEKSKVDGSMSLTNGLMQYAGVAQPIQNMEADIIASNQKITIRKAQLSASQNKLNFSGTVNDPLDEKRRNVSIIGNVNADLSTIKEFYPMDEDTLTLRGKLQSRFVVKGRLEPFDVEHLLQKSSIKLSNGYIAHKSVGEPLTDIQFAGTVSGKVIQISTAKFKTGNNSLSLKGNVQNYLSDDPVFNLKLEGNAMLSDIGKYYSLHPWIETLNGKAKLKMAAKGPAGDPLKIKLNGALTLTDVNAKGGELPLAVKNLNSTLSVTPNALVLNNFGMNFGSSDIQLSGNMKNYLGFLKEKVSGSQMPSISGTYKSKRLNLDEMIDWDEESDPNAPVPIELPALNAQVNANIGTLHVMGLAITNISGKGVMSPTKIELKDAKATLFEGAASGDLHWDIPKPTQTNIRFNGKLSHLKASSFLKETSFLGEKSTIHKYLEGALSADINYTSVLDATLSPKISTIKAEGSFGMTKSRLKGYPIQMEIAKLLRAKELENIALDDWKSDFTIKNEVLTFKNLNITSADIGLQMEGTHQLVSGIINYKATIALPSRFKKGMEAVLSKQAVEALEQENGTIAVPLVITGTSDKPKVRPDKSVIEDIVKKYLKKKGGDLIKNLFGGN